MKASKLAEVQDLIESYTKARNDLTCFEAIPVDISTDFSFTSSWRDQNSTHHRQVIHLEHGELEIDDVRHLIHQKLVKRCGKLHTQLTRLGVEVDV